MSTLKTILVVEDDAALQRAILFKLQKEGFKVLAASCAEEARIILESTKPDLIWLDMLLPGMGGLQFLELLRKKPEYKAIPVIVVSVSYSRERIKKAFELDIIDYIVKSQHELKDIVEKVKNYLSNQK